MYSDYSLDPSPSKDVSFLFLNLRHEIAFLGSSNTKYGKSPLIGNFGAQRFELALARLVSFFEPAIVESVLAKRLS